MATLGYRPNRAARALANGMDRAVTVLTSNTNLFGYAETLGGIEEAARAAGVHVASVCSRPTAPRTSAPPSTR